MNAPLFTLAVILVLSIAGGALWAIFDRERREEAEKLRRQEEAQRTLARRGGHNPALRIVSEGEVRR